MPFNPDEVIHLISSDLPQPPSYWGEGLLRPKARLILAAPAKSMKSFSVIHLGMSLATGRPFWGFPVPKPLRVLMVQMELPREEIKKRSTGALEAGCFNPDTFQKRFYIYSDTKFRLTLTQYSNQLYEWLMNNPMDIVIFDPLYRLHTKEENSNTEMQQVFDHLDDLVDKFGVALVIVHHYGKPGEFRTSGADRMRGSSALAGWADTLVYIQMPDHTQPIEEFKVEFDTRFCLAPDPITIKVGSGPSFERVYWDGNRHPETLVKILEVLRKSPNATSVNSLEEYALSQGISRATFYRWLKKFEEEKKISRFSKDGRAFIEMIHRDIEIYPDKTSNLL